MKGFIIKNVKTGKVYTGKAQYVDNPNYQPDTWDHRGNGYYFNYGGMPSNFSQAFQQSSSTTVKVPKPVTEKDKEQWPIFYRPSPWTMELTEMSIPCGSDGTNGPPWMKRIANYWGDKPKVFNTKKAADKILSTITKTYYKDRNNATTALLYLPDNVHDFKIVQVEVQIIEVEDGPELATTSSEPTKT